MREPGWAASRRRRWSATRIGAAALLHLLMLAALKAALDRVELARHGVDRATTLVDVALERAPPPIALPPPRPPARRSAAQAPPRRVLPAPRPIEDDTHVITLPAPMPAAAEPVAQAAATPASAPLPERFFLDSAATRQAIRDAARGSLATRASALTRQDQGSELVAADGSRTGETRHLPPPPPAQRLAQGIAAAHKNDCMKGEYPGAGMGLLSAPFLIAAEAMGKCAQK